MLYMMPSSILTSFIRTLVYHHIFFSLLIFPFPFSMSESDSVMPLYTGLIHPCHIHRTTHRQTNSRRFLFGSIYSWGRRQESHCVVRNLDLLRRETVGDAYLWVCMRKGLIHCMGGFICTFSLLSSLSFTFQSCKFNYSSSFQWQLKWLS